MEDKNSGVINETCNILFKKLDEKLPNMIYTNM